MWFFKYLINSCQILSVAECEQLLRMRVSLNEESAAALQRANWSDLITVASMGRGENSPVL